MASAPQFSTEERPAPSRVPAGDEAVVLERQEQELRPPSMYKVVLLNDDYTPMDFVVEVLRRIFGKDSGAAIQIMLKVHTQGSGICGVYTRDIATTKTEMVRVAARQAGHPLQCVYEPVE